MVDFIIRCCGPYEWLPIIVANGEELYRGDRYAHFDQAAEQAITVWENNGTGNIQEYKES